MVLQVDFMFYLPPIMVYLFLKTYVYQGAIFNVFTVVGILSAIGYVISAFMEYIVGSLSDRSTFKFGKRKRLWHLWLFHLLFVGSRIFPVTRRRSSP